MTQHEIERDAYRAMLCDLLAEKHQGGPSTSTWDRARDLLKNGERPICSGCKREIDPTMCPCGTESDRHTIASGHDPGVMGCVCHLDPQPQDPGPHTCETVLVEAGEQCTICGERYPADRGDLEARVLGAIIARPWLVAAEVSALAFDDERNRAVFNAIYRVQTSGGPLPQSAADMGLAVMRQIEGTPAADRVDLTYIASLVTVAEQAMGPAPLVLDPDDWFDGEVDALLARRAA